MALAATGEYHGLGPAGLATALRAEQRRRWQQGERVRAETYFEQYPALRQDPEGALDLIYHEVVLREEHGEAPSFAEYAERFPEHTADLRPLFEVHRAIEGGGALPSAAALTSGARPPSGDWTGRTIAHYLLEQRLGAGGMGEVYLARDLALGRPAALKILPPDFSPAQRTRLLLEAETTARLQHPGIATFYEAGEPGGVAFIALEYVPGQTLRERLQAGPLPPEQALAVTACLLEALGHAHAAGVLHRDLKPENIMLTGERSAKLLDFGIAKQVLAEPAPGACIPAAGPASTTLTQAGALVGTPGYMSPEQVRAEPLDARSDLFALGAVLYEAVTGRPAFPGATLAARLNAALSHDPPPPQGPGIPPGLAAVLSRALARDRSQRHPSAAALLADLRRLGFVDASAGLPDTLAVLDLQDLSGRPEDGWIGGGVADSLAAGLARIPGLQVVAREKVLRAWKAREAAGRPNEPPALGAALGCHWVLSGSFRKTGSRLRVTTRLTEVASAEVVRVEEQEDDVEAIFALQDRLAASVLETLRLQRPVPAAPAGPVLKFRAYECYARGRQLLQRMEKRSLEQAQELFEQAVHLEPGYGPALASLAGLHALRYTFTTDPRTLEVAAGYARRALEADPRVGEAHLWLGYVLSQQGRHAESYQAEMQALELDPSSYRAPYLAAGALMYSPSRQEAQAVCERITGRPCAEDPHRWRRREAIRLLQRAIEINPQHGWAWVGLGMLHADLGSLMEAQWCLQKALDLERQGLESPAGVEGFLAECLRRTGDLEGARSRCLAGLEAVEKTDSMYRDTFRGIHLCTLGRTALQQGDAEAARAAFTQAALHLRGRPRARGGGHVLVQALAGLAQAGAGPEPFEEALQLFERRSGYNFALFWGCFDDVSLLELFRAARALGRTQQARDLFARALDAGSVEAANEEMP